jgi:hypothetical protein
MPVPETKPLNLRIVLSENSAVQFLDAETNEPLSIGIRGCTLDMERDSFVLATVTVELPVLCLGRGKATVQIG